VREPLLEVRELEVALYRVARAEAEAPLEDVTMAAAVARRPAVAPVPRSSSTPSELTFLIEGPTTPTRSPARASESSRVPRPVITSKITLRLGLSGVTRNTDSPPIASSGLTMMSPCSRRKACRRALSLVTSAGALHWGNQARESFSLVLRSPCGRLTTSTPAASESSSR